MLFRSFRIRTLLFPHPGLLPALTLFGLWPFAYGVAILGGVPLQLLLQRKCWVFWWTYLLGGAALGCIPSLAFIFPGADGGWVTMAAIIGAAYGAISGAALWLIAGRTRAASVGI